MKRSGVADLPLHGGRVPQWLATRMTTLGTAISESVIHHYGQSALLSRLSDPFWFQALGSVMGMDWHSSGITTSVLYLHGFFLTKNGEWAVVQQGMNEASRLARRYHWHSATVRDFTCEPHTAIVGERAGVIQNLVDEHARPAQGALLTIASDSPQRTLSEVMKMRLPSHHDVRAKDVDLKRLGAVLAVSHARKLRDFASLLLVENLGPRTLQSLALIAEVIHGTPTRFTDPARFSFAHGGKDGHPFPVPLKTYDESIAVLRRSLDAARVGDTEKIDGMKRLDRFVRAIEKRFSPEADFKAVMAHEQAISKSLGGRSVFDRRPSRPTRGQLGLFD